LSSTSSSSPPPSNARMSRTVSSKWQKGAPNSLISKKELSGACVAWSGEGASALLAADISDLEHSA
jgi:hypothetical protein